MHCGKAFAVAWIRRHVELSSGGSRVDFVSAFKQRETGTQFSLKKDASLISLTFLYLGQVDE